MHTIKLLLAALALTVTACGGAGPAPEPTGEELTQAWLAAIPASCFTHEGKEYLGRAVSCTVGIPQDTCALDSGQKQTPVDGTGNPPAFLCNCFSDGFYSCLYIGPEFKPVQQGS